MSSNTDVSFVYFDGRGRGEIVRMMLTAAGIKYKEIDLKSREQYLELKKSLLFGQVPYMKYNGQEIVQSGAMVRHLARNHNLYGNPDQQTKVDEYFEGTRDFLNPFLTIGFMTPFESIHDKISVPLQRYLPIYDKILKENGNQGYLVGSGLTLADVGLLEVLLAAQDYMKEEVFSPHPHVQNFMKTMKEKEKFYSTYINEVRKPMTSPEIVASVKKILNYP